MQLYFDLTVTALIFAKPMRFGNMIRTKPKQNPNKVRTSINLKAIGYCNNKLLNWSIKSDYGNPIPQ